VRVLAGVLLASAACAANPKPVTPTASPPPAADPAPAPATDAVPAPGPATPGATPAVAEADTPRTTVAGNTFIAPAGWSVTVRAPATILTAPEGGSFVAIIDVEAKTGDDALALAWKAYDPKRKLELESSVPQPDSDGWTKGHAYEYITAPNARRTVGASVMFANGMWTVVIVDLDLAVAEKRGGQLGVMFGRFYPKGHDNESFKGKKAHELDATRIATLRTFVERAMADLQVPGVGLGIVQDGKVVLATGLGVRELGKKAPVDADTRFMIASNTKALTTLMLAKLVDEGKLTWDTPATKLLAAFELGDAGTTSKVLVKHLICACTGMPRQDFEWILEFANRTPESVITGMATMQPTSKFGELYQYSNVMAAAAGYVGAHVAFPRAEVGKAEDDAMQTRVFTPLGMRATTFNAKRLGRNVAQPYAIDLDGKAVPTVDVLNDAVIAVRPAGGAWSSVRDMLAYVQMELAEGKLPSGKVYVSRDALLARRAPQVAVSADTTYGMGLEVHSQYGITLINHGGDVFGYHSDMIWLPESGVGAVILTNGDGGPAIRRAFRRKLLEVLFDGRSEADADIAASVTALRQARETFKQHVTIPAAPAAVGALATHYVSESLGALDVSGTTFDFGEFKTEVGTRTNTDGTTSFITTTPGIMGLELVAGEQGGKRTLTLRDAQHDYVFVEK